MDRAKVERSAALVSREDLNYLERQLEFVYQAYRMQFSDAYFAGSSVCVGDSVVDAARDGHPRTDHVVEFLIRLRDSTPKRWSVNAASSRSSRTTATSGRSPT